MRNFLMTLTLIISGLTLFAQSDTTGELKTLLDNEQYDAIIDQYASKQVDYSAKDLYYIGYAYYMKEDDDNCIKYMDLSIARNPDDPAPYYIKGSSLKYMKKYDEAASNFQSAIKLKPDDPRYYSGLGDCYYYSGKSDLAIESYQKAIGLKDCPDRPYSLVAQIYFEQNQNEKALESYYVVKSKIDKSSDSYQNALYNIGLLEFMNGNYEKSETAYIELLQINPIDYQTYAKLIQVYYEEKEYDKATPYKDKLYQAHNSGLLEGKLNDRFCFDQFKWNDKTIQAYERYEDGSNNIYYKQIFYVVNNENQIEYTIQTEYSPISVEQGGSKYLLCRSKGDTHSTYNIGFNDNFQYDALKKHVIDILEEKVKPAASFKPNK